jgi:16S rRNA (guanine527-N7)-methyltransferase
VSQPAPIEEILAEARDLGFLGPGPIEQHLRHAAALADLALEHLARPEEARWLDLGSGGGVPGLVWLATRTTGAAVLLDASARRCAFLVDALSRLQLTHRARVLCGRAEALARDADHRGALDLIVARSFGPPATTAECAVGFLQAGGRLVVSEPPSNEGDAGAAPDSRRWPTEGLERLGLGPATVITGAGATVAIMQRQGGSDDGAWPRRDGIPAKRPLW